MDLATLYRLLSTLADEKHLLETAVLLVANPQQQTELEQRAHKIAVIVTDIRGEVVAREVPGASSATTTQEFEAHLRRVLSAHGLMESLRGKDVRKTA